MTLELALGLKEATLIDFEVSDTGSIGLFLPVSLDAQDFAASAFAGAQWWGSAVAIERRYCLETVSRLVNEEGFIVAIDGRVVDHIEEA